MNFRLFLSTIALFSGSFLLVGQSAADYYSIAKKLQKQGRVAEAIAFYSECLKIEPENTDALFNQAGVYFSEGQYENAAVNFQKVADLVGLDAEALDRMGNCYFMLKQFDKSVDAYQQSLGIKPSNRVFVNCSLARQEFGDFPGAVSDAEKAIGMDDKNARAWSAKGTALFKMEQGDSALAALRQAQELAPNDPEILANLGSVLCKMGFWREALIWLNKSLAYEPSVKGFVNRAQCFWKLRDLPAALTDIEDAELMAPANADVLNTRGLYWMETNELELAVKSFTNAMAWSPEQPDALYNRSQALFRLGRFQEAVVDLNALIKQRPNAAPVRYARAKAHLELQEFDDACTDFQEAKKLGLEDISGEYSISFCRN